jgi:hypothetical protein
MTDNSDTPFEKQEMILINPIEFTEAKDIAEQLWPNIEKAITEIGEHPPTVFLLFEDATCLIPVGRLMEDGITKMMLSERLQNIAKKPEVLAICMTFEAWAVEGIGQNGSNELNDYLEEHQSLENHPQRKEVIMLHIETRDELILRTAYIERLDNSIYINGTKDINALEDNSYCAGTFAGFFSRRQKADLH